MGVHLHFMHVQAAPSAERESLYEDFMKEKEKKEREAKKAERKRRMAAFRDLLENTKSIKVRGCLLALAGIGAPAQLTYHTPLLHRVGQALDHEEMGSAYIEMR